MIRINNHIFFVLNHVYKTSLKTSLKCFKAPSLYNKNTENSQLKSQQTLIFLITLKAETKKGKVIEQILEKHNENDVKMRVAV